MSDFIPTASQRAAIELRNGAVLVAAGAGSGKTKVLTERLMSYISDPVSPADIDSFLVISFTRAAAGELRGRISQELAARLAQEPENRRLRRQSALCQRAQIGTIHSFCAALLREHSHLAGLSPDFKIADEQRSDAMKAAALERVLEERYERADSYPGFTLLADTVGAGRDDSRLAKLVLELHGRMQSHARPELWAKAQAELLRQPAVDAAQTPWGREVLRWAGETVAYWSEEFDRLMAAMAESERISAAYTDSFSATAEQLRELERRLRTSWDAAAAMGPVTFPTLGRLLKSPDPGLSDMLKARRDACKKAMTGVCAALNADSAQLLRELRETAPAMEALLSLTLDFDAAFAADKRSRALVDYSDLEHMTARLLSDGEGRPTELARQLSARYTEIMVDEYQDVSRVQDAIFQAVSKNGRNLFMVGDVKQSIYRFRLADPEIFNRKYLSYANGDGPEGLPRRVLLRENFRSRREVVDGVNSVFGLCMSRQLGDIDYDGAAALRFGAGYTGSVPVPELLVLDLPSAGEDGESPERAAVEAELAARRIEELMDSGVTVWDRGGERPLRYDDIAILLRSPGGSGGVYRRVLAERGIPVSSVQGAGFFSSVEVSAVTSMLAVIENPHQDIPLIAALRSPAFGFTADELSAIRAADRDGDLYAALCAAGETQPRCAKFLERLAALRGLAADLSAAELTWLLIEQLDLLALCSAMDGGEQRRARLMELVELSEKFESTGYRGLYRFVLWLKKLAEKGQEPDAGNAAGAAVQIMSIHKSKGLEFPVVFLCDTARQFNRQDLREAVLVHPELGLGPKLTDTRLRAEYPTLARNAIRLRLERELLSEEMRLMYVALTRARERLYMTAAMKNAEKKIEELRSRMTVPMAPELLRQAGSMAVWLIYACLADGGEQLRMTLCRSGEEPAGSAEPAGDAPQADSAAAERLRRNLAFRYAHAEAEALPSKVTATELKDREDPDGETAELTVERETVFRLPDLEKAHRPLTGAERGIATHLLLQYVDFGRVGSRESIRSEAERLERAGFLSGREAAAVDVAAVERLFRSPIGRRMLAAERTVREFRFSLLWDAERIYAAAPGEELLMQGVVDCCIFEDGALTIVDYKTDRVKTPVEIGRRAEYYRGQLMVYAQALTRIFGLPVRECVLYFLSAGQSVTVYESEEKT